MSDLTGMTGFLFRYINIFKMRITMSSFLRDIM